MMTKPSTRMVHSSMSMPTPLASTMLRVTTATVRKMEMPTWCVTKIRAQDMKNLQQKSNTSGAGFATKDLGEQNGRLRKGPSCPMQVIGSFAIYIIFITLAWWHSGFHQTKKGNYCLVRQAFSCTLLTCPRSLHALGYKLRLTCATGQPVMRKSQVDM